MNRRIATLCAAATAALITSQVRGATIFWQGTGVSGSLTTNNYSDGTLTNQSPTSSDIVNFGGGGTATHSVAGVTSFAKLRVGHNLAPGGSGTGTVTVNSGASINLTVGAAGDPGLAVGWVQNGTLTIAGSGTSVTSAQLIEIGTGGSNLGRLGKVDVTGGASLTATAGNINVGAGSSNGIPGQLSVDGTVSATGTGADLLVGRLAATSSVTQSGGTITIRDRIEVAPGSSTNSFFTVTNGTTQTQSGAIAVGLGSSVGAKFNLSGTGTVSSGARFVMGADTATGVVMNHSGGTLTTVQDVRVADAFTAVASDATYNLSGTGVINSTTGGIVGRQGVGKFIQTGGDANFGGNLSIGNRDTATLVTANGLYKISAGDFDVTGALNIAPNGAGEFRVVGDDATLDVSTTFTVGNTANGNGTLAFELETGDLLSQIAVAGAATFATGTNLIFDTTNAAPTQTSYNLLTATAITDGGITFSGPANWSYQIIDGGNGKILQAIAVPEPGSLAGLLVLTALPTLRRRRRS